MKLRIILILLFFTKVFMAYSQTNICSFNDKNKVDNYYKFLQGNYENDDQIDKIIAKIVTEIGLEKNFIFVNSPNFNNCAALNFDGFRFILYDKAFLNKLSINQLPKLSVYTSVIAHEIGHHLQGHTLNKISNEKNKSDELEADKFSGYIMAKLDYSLDDAKEAMRSVPNSNSNTHPNKILRLNSIDLGYKLAKYQINNNINTIENNLYIKFFTQGQEDLRNNLYYSAADNFTTAIALNKDNIFFPLSLRALSYAKGGNYDLSIKDYEKLAKVEMLDKKVLADYLYFNKGVTYEKMENYQEAASNFYKAYNLNALDKISIIKYAKNLYLTGQYTEAVKTFELQIKDNDIYESELQNYTQADVFLQKADSYLELGDILSAIKYIDIAEKLYPINYPYTSNLFFFKGKVFEKLGNSLNAKINYTKSCELGHELGCKFSKTQIDIKENTAIFGGFKTTLILEYKYNYKTSAYDLMTESEVESLLFFEKDKYSFKKGKNKWLSNLWHYSGFDDKRNRHYFLDSYGQTLFFDKDFSSITWQTNPKEGFFEKMIVYKTLTSDKNVIPD